ncbi:unnamed protein product, partial [Protopolystoma xenopodis]
LSIYDRISTCCWASQALPENGIVSSPTRVSRHKRRDPHQNCDLALDEFATSGLIANSNSTSAFLTTSLDDEPARKSSSSLSCTRLQKSLKCRL